MLEGLILLSSYLEWAECMLHWLYLNWQTWGT